MILLYNFGFALLFIALFGGVLLPLRYLVGWLLDNACESEYEGRSPWNTGSIIRIVILILYISALLAVSVTCMEMK